VEQENTEARLVPCDSHETCRHETLKFITVSTKATCPNQYTSHLHGNLSWRVFYAFLVSCVDTHDKPTPLQWSRLCRDLRSLRKPVARLADNSLLTIPPKFIAYLDA